MGSSIYYVSSTKLDRVTLDHINNLVDSIQDITEEQRVVRKLQLIKHYESELNLKHKSELGFCKRIFSK